MAADDAGERTEQPTPRRRQEAREQGNVPKSADLTAAVSLLAALVLLNWFGTRAFGQLLDLVREYVDVSHLAPGGVQSWLWRAAYALLLVAGPFLGVLLLATAGAGFIQTGAAVTVSLLRPKLDKLNPVQGFQNLFSFQAVRQLGTAALKMLFVGGVAWWYVSRQIAPVLAVGQFELSAILPHAAGLVYSLGLRLALVLLLLGLVDYFIQWRTVEKSLRMSKEEIREEMKRMEGDPHIKARRRQIQQKLMLQRIRRDVPRADVIVTNPTEFAVALRYREGETGAPVVVAKGKDFLALQIRLVAQQHGVPIVQKPPLARALYAAVEVGQEIPPAYYRAVAELLAYVYQIAGRMPALARGA